MCSQDCWKTVNVALQEQSLKGHSLHMREILRKTDASISGAQSEWL